MDVARYAATEALRGGRWLVIRAARPADQDDLAAALTKVSDPSLYGRFFSPRGEFTQDEIASYLDIDFSRHVALAALVEEDGRPTMVGAGRYILIDAGRAELAFGVIDAYQGRGVGGALLRHLAVIARDAGLREFVAEVLPENIPMLNVLRKSGFPIRATCEPGLVHVVLALSAAPGDALSGT